MIESERIGGAALIAAAAGTVLAMAHHPTSAHSASIGEAVHGALILLLALTAFGFAAFAAARGASRPAMLAGSICYAVALVGHIGAATINGFVVPALAARAGADIGQDIFLFAWEANQALARLGVIAAGLAFLLWSIDFLRRRGTEAKAIGALGLVAGAAPTALLFADLIEMDLAGAFLAYASHAAWTGLVGFHMIRERAAAELP